MYKIFTFKNLKYAALAIAIALLCVSIYSVSKRYIDNSIDNGIVTYFNDHKDELKGDKGDEGVAGEQGPQGSIGNTGASGRAGATGKAGAAGATGKTGAQGSTGAKGSDGSDGQDGCTAYYSYGIRYWYCP